MKKKTSFIRILITILVIFCAVSLVTCNGIESYSSPPNEAGGIWRGTVTFVDNNGWSGGGGTVLGLIDYHTTTNIIFENISYLQLEGEMYGYQGTLSSESYLTYVNGHPNMVWYDEITESYLSPGSTLTATIHDYDPDGYSLILNLTYDTLYDRPSSISYINGAWMGTVGFTGISLGIWHSGSISGKDDNGCIYSGSVKISDPAHNMYCFEMTSSCVGGYRYGLGILTDTDAANDTLIIGMTGLWDSYVYRLKRQ